MLNSKGFCLCLCQSCSECTEPTLAQSLCTLCNKWLCYQCTDVHQHQRAPATSQYTDMHQQQRPSATQCPDLHQRGSSSLPPTGQGKLFMHFRTLFQPLSRPVWQIISGAAQPSSLSFENLFGFCFHFCALFVNHVSAGVIAMNNAWQLRCLMIVSGDPCVLLHPSLTHVPDSEVLSFC